MHSGHLHFETISSVPGCGGHLQIFLQSSDVGVGRIHSGPGPIGGVPGSGMHPQVHSDDETTDIAANAIQMPMITVNATVKFIFIVSVQSNFKNWIIKRNLFLIYSLNVCSKRIS